MYMYVCIDIYIYIYIYMQVPFMPMSPIRADVGWPWRMDWGGPAP